MNEQDLELLNAEIEMWDALGNVCGTFDEFAQSANNFLILCKKQDINGYNGFQDIIRQARHQAIMLRKVIR